MRAPSDQVRHTKCRNGLHWMTEANTIIQRQPSTGGVYYRCKACKRNARRASKSDPDVRRRVVAKAKARGLPPGDPRHGTASGRTYWGCDCDECRAAHSTATRVSALRAKARRLGVLPSGRNIIGKEGLYSLDSIRAVRGDNYLQGRTIWDDPVADEALGNIEGCA